MTERIQNIMNLISDELTKQFPDQKPIIAALTDNSFTYELEKHGNFTYYMVGYDITPSGTLTVDWDNAELVVI
jgi:hypothetical protein